MASALWLGSMEPQWLAPFLSLPVQVMVTPEMMVPVLPGQRFLLPRMIGKRSPQPFPAGISTTSRSPIGKAS